MFPRNVTTWSQSESPSRFNIVLMVTVPLTGRMGLELINNYETVKMFFINTMLHFDADFAGHGHGDVTCKQTFSTMFNIEYLFLTWKSSYNKVGNL